MDIKADRAARLAKKQASAVKMREALALKRATQPPPPPKPPKPEMVTVTLQLRHPINGIFYGPGRVTVSRAQAEAFFNTEYEAASKELSLNQQQAFIIGWGPGGPVKRQVPVDRFEAILAREGGG